ncbi:hypothetical protein HMPREF9134_00257 [Porphyromonas catoniae F0037]|uniref:Uncharacterized protein n=1 Tax=Porphyromonas catoniae F0037 TaxID=1127696 RepID=L1NHH8_9PORP|nr:hypothetical protein HMPREF9134_00257 [Porphyromonas catoniae F0037]
MTKIKQINLTSRVHKKKQCIIQQSYSYTQTYFLKILPWGCG